MCHLQLRDGVMRMGKSTVHKVEKENVDEWFNLLGDTPMASKLKSYAQVLRYLLGE